MKLLVKAFWKPLIWLLFICYLTLTPSDSLPEIPKLFEYDKIGHLMLFFIFSLLCIKGFSIRLNSFSTAKIKWMVLLISVSIGGIIEILQAQFITNRNGDITDFVADLTGILLGIFLYDFFAKRFYKLM